MKKSLKVLFFGNERIATGVHSKPVVFNAIIESGHHDIVGLIIHASGSTSRTKTVEPIVELAGSYSIPVLNPTNPKDAIQQIKSFGADVGVLVAYGKIVPKELIDLFPLGIINLHPSKLPKLRGSTPLESVLLRGDSDTAVSIMKLETKMDAGPILAQKSLSVPKGVSKQDLADNVHLEGADLMLNVLDKLSDASQDETKQDDNQATYCSVLTKSDGLLDWSKPAEQLEKEVRAYAGWPTSYFENNSQRYVITKAHASYDKLSDTVGTLILNEKTLGIQSNTGIFWIDCIQPAGKKEMPVEAFLNGYRSKLSN